MLKVFFIAIIIISVIFLSLNPKLSYSYSFNFSSVNFLNPNVNPRLNYANEIIFKEAYNNYMNGKYKQAAGQFWLYTTRANLLENYALYYQGLCFIKLKEFHKADYVLLKLLSLFPKFAFYKSAVFSLAISENKNGYYYSEISHLKYIIRHSSKSSVRSYAMFKIYKTELKLKNDKKANQYLLRLYIDYPHFSKIHDIHFKDTNLDYSQKIRRGIDLYYDSYYSESLSLLKDATGPSRKKAAFISLKDLMKLKSPLFLKKANECLNRAQGIDCYKYYGVGKLEILNLKTYYYYIMHNRQETMHLLNYIAEQYGFLDKNPKDIYKEIVWNKVLMDLKSGKLVSAAKSLKSFFIVDDKVNANTAKFLFWYGVILKKLGYKNRASFYFNIIKGSRFLRYSYYGIMSDIMINKLRRISKTFVKRENVGYIYNNSNADKNIGGNNSFGSNIIDSPQLRMLESNITFKRFKAFLNLKLYFLSNIEMQRLIGFIHKKFSGEKGASAGKNIASHANNINIKTLSGVIDKINRITLYLAYMLYKNRYYGTAISLTSYLIYNYKYKSLLLNKQFLKILYPMPYLDYVRKYSVRYGVPVNLIYGIMRQESLYNPVCYSSAGAIGLMQIIPSTGYYIARRTGCYNFNPSMLYKKNININFGSYYLKTLLDRFNNRKYLAIASYNAGPDAVAYWKNSMLKSYRMLLFIELIPISQTRNYVKKVLANYYVYNSLYGY